MSAAIAGPAIIAASPTLPSKNFFMTKPPVSPVRVVSTVATIASLDTKGCDISATMKGIRQLGHSAKARFQADPSGLGYRRAIAISTAGTRSVQTSKNTGLDGRSELPARPPRGVVDGAKVLEYRWIALGWVGRPVLRPSAVHSIREGRWPVRRGCRDGSHQENSRQGTSPPRGNASCHCSLSTSR
jgi:hypothetical protein